MRRRLTLSVLRLSLFIFWLATLVGLPAVAQAEVRLQPWIDHRVNIKMPVSWEITRSDFTRNGVATETETFRETWTLVMGPGLRLFLVSPRAKVSVNGIHYRKTNGWMPTYIVLSEEHFARLLGFPPTYVEEPTEAIEANLIFIKLLSPNASGENLTLHLSKDEFFSVHLSVGL